jgi:hypothetical protein
MCSVTILTATLMGAPMSAGLAPSICCAALLLACAPLAAMAIPVAIATPAVVAAPRRKSRLVVIGSISLRKHGTHHHDLLPE